MAHSFFIALSLVFVLEGIFPFLWPAFWRRYMQQMVTQNDQTLRIMGLVSMLIGLALLYWIH
jgi:uncharacterized protein YjeT (DUF2065 family)